MTSICLSLNQQQPFDNMNSSIAHQQSLEKFLTSFSTLSVDEITPSTSPDSCFTKELILRFDHHTSHHRRGRKSGRRKEKSDHGDSRKKPLIPRRTSRSISIPPPIPAWVDIQPQTPTPRPISQSRPQGDDPMPLNDLAMLLSRQVDSAIDRGIYDFSSSRGS